MATINTSGSNTTLTLSYTTANAKLLNFINDALNYLYPSGYTKEGDEEPTLISELTSQEKGDLIEAKCKEYVLSCATAYQANSQAEIARDQALEDAKTRYE